MPTIDDAACVSVGTVPFAVTSEIGSCSAIEWTFERATPLIPVLVGFGNRWNVFSGRRPSRSKTEPRSTKKESARWSGEHLPASGQVLDRRDREIRLVRRVRRRALPDVDRRRRRVAHERVLPVAVDAPQREELLHVLVGVVRGADRTGVVEERVRVLHDGAEPQRVRDVVLDVTVVVDVDLVADVVSELGEVRAAVRLLEPDVARDDVELRRVVRVAERLKVRVVRHRVRTDERRLPVTGRACGPRAPNKDPGRHYHCRRHRDEHSSA